MHIFQVRKFMKIGILSSLPEKLSPPNTCRLVAIIVGIVVTYSCGRSTAGTEVFLFNSSIKFSFHDNRLVCQTPRPNVAAGKSCKMFNII